jgi:hypothetical protein
MQRDQKGKPNAEHDEGNQKMTVMENGAELFGFGHGGPSSFHQRLAQP